MASSYQLYVMGGTQSYDYHNDKIGVAEAVVLRCSTLDDSGLTGTATAQLALSLQEIPSGNAMEMGQIMKRSAGIAGRGFVSRSLI